MNEQSPSSSKQNLIELITDEMPPWMKDFVLKNWKQALSAVLILFLGAAIWSGYSVYSKSQKEKAALALGSALNISDRDKKIETLKKVANEYRKTPVGQQALLILAAAYRDSEKMDLAEETFKKALKELKKGTILYESAQMGLGYLHENAKKYEGAKTEFLAGAEKNSGYKTVALLDLARIYQNLGQYKKAIDTYNQYLSLNKDSKQNDYINYQMSRLGDGK